jgi:hypothetical protein
VLVRLDNRSSSKHLLQHSLPNMAALPADLLVNNTFLIIPSKIVAIREGTLGRQMEHLFRSLITSRKQKNLYLFISHTSPYTVMGGMQSNSCPTLGDLETKSISFWRILLSASSSDLHTIVRIYIHAHCRAVRHSDVAENGTGSLIARTAESWKVAYHWCSTRSRSGRQYLMFGWVKAFWRA